MCITVAHILDNQTTQLFYLNFKNTSLHYNFSTVILHSNYIPAGDQPEAIARLISGIDNGATHQTLKGITGSGKTFTMANVIHRLKRPTIILAPNKTLTAQLYDEMKRPKRFCN